MEASSNIYAQLAHADNENIAAEPVTGAVTLKEKLTSGVTADQFLDYLLQLCDAVEFLSQQKPPVSHNAINANNIIICEDDLLKLTNFEQATSGSLTNDMRSIGELICSIDAKYARKYRNIGKAGIANEFESIDELRNEIMKCAAVRNRRVYKYLLLLLAALLLFARVFRRFIFG